MKEIREPMRVETLFTGVANTHIIENENGIVIIDAGMPHMTQRILGKIRARGYAPQAVRLILLTHGHIDHVGSAVALKRLTGAPIALHAADIPLTATRALKIPPGRSPSTETIGKVLRALGWLAPIDTFEPDILLEEGQSLRDLGFDARVVHTPGHTAGSVTFVTQDGAAFVGDAILNLVHVAFPLFWEDANAAHASACKIQSLNPRVCYSGHGKAFALQELDAFVSNHCE